jgi:hypothetical protein
MAYWHDQYQDHLKFIFDPGGFFMLPPLGMGRHQVLPLSVCTSVCTTFEVHKNKFVKKLSP